MDKLIGAIKSVASTTITLAITVAFVIGIGFGARASVRWLFDGVNATVAAAIVAAVTTTLVSVLGLTLGRYLERRHQIEVELRERKVPIYTEFVEGLMKFLASSGEGYGRPRSANPEVGANDIDLVAFFHKMTPQLMIWASNDVVSKWSVFRRAAGKRESLPYMFMMEELLTAIRKDLGHPGDLPEGDLLGLFINDIDAFIGDRAKR